MQLTNSGKSMFIEQIMQTEDEDVVLEGTDLHEALLTMGYTNFDSVPKMKMESDYPKMDILTNYQSINQSLKNRRSLIGHHLLQEDKLRKLQLQTILGAKILLDDHVIMISDFLNEQHASLYRKCLEWIPLIGTTIFASFFPLVYKSKNITTAVTTFTISGFFVYGKLKCCIAVRKLKQLVTLQNELHNLIKQALKILRRMYGKHSLNSELKEKHELIGTEKFNVIVSIKQVMIDILENLSKIYYQCAKHILDILPDVLKVNCTLTEFQIGNNEINYDKSFDELKSLYYTFILVQSEMMFILATAYNSKTQDSIFAIPNVLLLKIIKDLTMPLVVYHSKLSKVMLDYQACEIKPIRRVFRGIPNSKWQDTYIHLDLTSQRVQLAYKEILSILQVIDAHSEFNEDDSKLVESITEKMNEAYKHIENAKSFAEFSSLLIAKAQHKCILNPEREKENENLFPVANENKNVVMIDKDPEIEDEVFEEYIKEEYLKPLYENSSDGDIQNFKLNKLLAKNFMSELKEALIEKQRSMNERELKALKRMYGKICKDASINNTLTDASLAAVNPPEPGCPPPPPPPPPPTMSLRLVAENETAEPEPLRGERQPVPLPRVKTFQPDAELPDVQRFSIGLPPPALGVAEETFLGSGENSDEEYAASSEESEGEIPAD